VRDVPLVEQLSHQLAAHKQASPFAAPGDWVFATSRGTPYGHRNAARRVLTRAADAAQLNGDGWPPLRFHDLRHTFASHLIVDLGLDVAQVSRILGHARITITLDVYTHLFDGARHTREIRRRMAASQFASLLDPDSGEAPVTMLSHSMRGRAGLSDRSTEPTPALPPFAQRGSAMPGDQGSCNAWDAESGWPCDSESGGLPMPRSMSNL
jgi:hypothetical protein